MHFPIGVLKNTKFTKRPKMAPVPWSQTQIMKFSNVSKENTYASSLSARLWLKNSSSNILMENIEYCDVDVKSVNDRLEN